MIFEIVSELDTIGLKANELNGVPFYTIAEPNGSDTDQERTSLILEKITNATNRLSCRNSTLIISA